MAKAKTVVGLDVHAAKIVAAVLDAETGQLNWFQISGDAVEAAGFCAGLPRPVRVAYEAGPTGYGFARELARRGGECVVAAPSKIPRASGDRVKTDRRDAEHLVRLLLAGKLHPVRVPGDEEEALRDLVRAREAVRVDLMRCRHRLSKLLLRHGIRFDDGRAWTDRHRAWLSTLTLDWPAAQATMIDAQGAIDAFCHRREALEREIIAMLPACPWAVQVGRLRCLRGIDTLSAVGLYSGLTRSHPSRTVLAAGRVYRSRHEDDLPVAAVLFGKAVSLSSFGQRNGLRNPGQQRASRHHLHKLPEGFGVLLDEHRSLSDPATGIVGDRPGADDHAPVSTR